MKQKRKKKQNPEKKIKKPRPENRFFFFYLWVVVDKKQQDFLNPLCFLLDSDQRLFQILMIKTLGEDYFVPFLLQRYWSPPFFKPFISLYKPLISLKSPQILSLFLVFVCVWWCGKRERASKQTKSTSQRRLLLKRRKDLQRSILWLISTVWLFRSDGREGVCGFFGLD